MSQQIYARMFLKTKEFTGEKRVNDIVKFLEIHFIITDYILQINQSIDKIEKSWNCHITSVSEMLHIKLLKRTKSNTRCGTT